MSETYRTVGTRASAAFEVRGSEFIGHVKPVETVAGAEAFAAEVEAEHADATHHVPAYRVRADPFREYSSDDGEPSGSAGKPALNVLQGEGIENAVCVVTRYYGGTHLGYGGLVRAYSRAVSEALDAAGIVEERPHDSLKIAAEYDDSGTVRGIIESSGCEFDATYDERATFAVRVPSEERAELCDRLRDATSGRVGIE
ncbi:IMPACT family protein [Halalkalicoccus subterraneus]|uniref:IMPACT family protein n=1 Tax=Halalkalicoccus subterraneus TaxID=2675002 RepID=UPI000EFCBAA3|nr:YigZ family protein [Halalkalicoccus subterraneus]